MKTGIYSGAIGAAIGGYTQYDSSDPSLLAMGAGAFVGGGIGASLDYPAQSIRGMRQAFSDTVKTSIATSNIHTQNILDAQSRFQQKYKGFNARLGSIDQRLSSLQGLATSDAQLERLALTGERNALLRNTVHNINSVLSASGLGENRFTSLDEVSKFVTTQISHTSSGQDLQLLRGINYGFGFKDQLQKLESISIKAPEIKTETILKSIGINQARGVEELEGAIDVFTTRLKSLGHGDQARALAEGTLRAEILQGREVGLAGQNLIIGSGTDKVTVPLTRVQDVDGSKVRTTFATMSQVFPDDGYVQAGRHAIASQWSPNAMKYMKTPGAPLSMVAGEDPLTMLQHAHLLKGDTPQEKLKRSIENMHSLMRHSATDAYLAPGQPFSDYARTISERVNVGRFSLQEKMLKGKPTGEFELKALSKSFGADEPWFTKFVGQLAIQSGQDPLSYTTPNSFTDIRNPILGERTSPYAFSVASRGADQITIREQRAAAGAPRFAPHEVLGMGESRGATFGIRTDVDRKLSKVISAAFGNKYVIDEGFMLGSRDQAIRFTSETGVSLRLGNMGTPEKPIYMSSIAGLMDAINHKAGIQAGLAGIAELQANTPIGLDPQGAPLTLKGYLSKGKIVDILQDEKGLNLIIEGVTDPTIRNEAKIFSGASKANVGLMEGRQFNAAISMAKLYNSGAFEVESSDGTIRINRGFNVGQMTSGGHAFRAGTTVSATDFRDILYRAIRTTESGASLDFDGRTMRLDSTLLGGWDDVGQGDIGKMIRQTNIEGPPDPRFFQKYADKPGAVGAYAKRMMGASGVAQIAGARALLAISDTKAAQDIVDTALQYQHQQFGWRSVKRMEVIAKRMRQGTATDKNIDFYLRNVATAFTQGDASDSVTRFVANLGEGIHGIGNTGKYSHLELQQLRSQIGYSEEVLKKMGGRNLGALHEVEMIRSAIEGGEISAQSSLKKVIEAVPEQRLEKLAEAGFNVRNEKGFVNVGLETRGMSIDEMKGIRSVPISFYDTGRSGIFTQGESEILKHLDARRTSVISTSAAYSEALAGGDVNLIEKEKGRYMKSLENLYEQHRVAFKGDNNVFKTAITLESSTSNITMARSIGGSASVVAEREGAKFLERKFFPELDHLTPEEFRKRIPRLSNVGFIAEEQAAIWAREWGVDILDEGGRIRKSALEDLGGGIFRVKAGESGKWLAQVAREPSQGSFSSLAMELLIDTSLGKEDVGRFFSPQLLQGDKNIQNLFQFLDYDADTLRVGSLHNMSKIEIAAIEKNRIILLQEAARLATIQDKIGVKGKDKAPITITDFRSRQEYLLSQVGEGMKARFPKVVAAQTTGAVMGMHAAIDLAMGPAGAQTDAEYRRMIHAKNLAHNLTENLLKTKHKEGSGGLFNQSAVTKILEAQAAFNAAEQKSGEATYRSALRNIIDTTLPSSTLNVDERKVFDVAADDLVNAMARHSRTIGERSPGVLDLPRRIMEGDARTMSQAIDDIGIKSGRLPGVETTSRAESLQGKIRSSLPYGKDVIMRTLADNKGKLASMVIGLGAIAALSGSKPIQGEALASAQPSAKQKQAQPLEPFKDRKSYVRKYNPQSGNHSMAAKVRTNRENMNPSSIQRALFGDNSSSARVNYSDITGL
jgi:hypothetical protein